MKKLLSLLLAVTLISGLIPYTDGSAAKVNATSLPMILYPAPRQGSYATQTGTYTLTAGNITFDANTPADVKTKVKADVLSLTNITLTEGSGGKISFTQDGLLHTDGYSLKIDGNGVTVKYKDKNGAFWAAATLKQIMFQKSAALPYLAINNDYPDFPNRAFEMDISRNRLPNMDTAKRVIDIMADLKYNQLFFYFEGFSYAYASHPQVWENGDPLTPAQAREIADYCAARNIDFIPSQNSFGHMSQWIARPEFQSLGDTQGSTTLNLFNPDTQELVNNLYTDLFTNGFTTNNLLVGGDETNLNLVSGNAAASWKALPGNAGKEPTQQDLYVDSMKLIYDMAKAKNKNVMFWADMILHYSDTMVRAKALMPDAVAMDWGYLHDYDFAGSTAMLKNAGFQFYVCPGDSSWSTIAGNTSVMNENAENAAIYGKQNGAVGYLMTNWGDAGHYQNIITTYPAIVYAAGLSWNYDTNVKTQNSYDEYLNRFIYNDTTDTLSQAFSTLADFSDMYLPYGWNGNWIANCLIEPYTENTKNLYDFMDFQDGAKNNSVNANSRDHAITQCGEVAAAADTFLQALSATDITAQDKDLLNLEFKNTGEMAKAAANYVAMRLRLFTGGNITTPLSTADQEKTLAAQLAVEYNNIINDFKDIWMQRDVYGDLPSTLGWISKPAMMYRDIAGVTSIYKPQADGNMFIKTPQTLGNTVTADDFVVDGWTWTNYGTGTPAISNTYMGSPTVGQLRNALNNNVFSTVYGLPGTTGYTFAYDAQAAVDGGFYQIWDGDGVSPLLPRCGWPAVAPNDNTNYVVTARVKFKNSTPVNTTNIILAGGANKISNGALTDVPPQGSDYSISAPDENGWCTLKVIFKVNDYNAISFGILPSNSVRDTLYITDLYMTYAESAESYMAATDENASAIIPELWNWGQNPTAVYTWTNDNTPGSMSFMNYNLSNPAVWDNTIAGNRTFRIIKKYQNAYAVAFTSNAMPAGDYTFFFWMKGTGIVDSAGNPATSPNPGFLDLQIFSGDTLLTTQTDQRNGWFITYPSIEAANTAGGATGFNSVNGNSFGWSLVRVKFNVPADEAGVPLKLNLNIIGESFGFSSLDLDGFGLVKSNSVPSFESFYSEDIDRDGIKNINDTDMDGDGIQNIFDTDADGDGVEETGPSSYMAATDENASAIIPELWNWGQNPTAVYTWTNDNTPGSMSFMNYNLSNPAVWDNTIAGNRVFRVIKKYGNAYALLFTSNAMPAGDYTFFFWMKGTGIVDSAGNPVTSPNPGFLDLQIFSGDTLLTTSNDQRNGWFITYPSIEAANADGGTTGFNGVNGNSFGWSLVRVKFNVPADKAGVPLKLNLNLIGETLGFSSIDFDGLGLVAGNSVPLFESFYSNDIDRDGIKNINDTDMDGDGIPNSLDPDADGDGVEDA
jgi:hexosaminidase